jgi:antitoxin component HigA of HigAB toxin-antitoxin module
MEKLKNEMDYQLALSKIWVLMKLEVKKESEEGDELEMLLSGVEAYEKVYFQINLNGLKESHYFLKSPKNAERLKKGIADFSKGIGLVKNLLEN